MTDSDLEFQSQLRNWFRSEVTAEVAAPASLRTAMAAIPATVPTHVGYRRWILLAVTVAALATMASAAAIGSGLIRLPEPRPVLVPLGGPCEPQLDEALLFEAGGELLDHRQYLVYRDGLVLIYETRTGWPFDRWIRQRHLTTEGIESLLAAATQPGLDGCRSVPLREGTPDVQFAVRDGAEVNEFQIGYGRYSHAEADDATTEAAAEMFRRLTDPDLKVPPDQWVEEAWTEYVPEAYEVTVSIDENPDGTPDEIWDLPLPDGSTWRTIGQPFEDPENAGRTMRCAAMGTADVRALREHVAGLLPPYMMSRGLFEGFGAFPIPGEISAGYTLPHERPCTDEGAGSASDVPQDPNLELMSIDVCGLLEGAPLPGGGTVTGADRRAWVSSDASNCDFPNWPFSRISLRVWPTSAADARELVRLAFGDGSYRTIEMGEATAYRNCDACLPAMVVSAEPYLLVIESLAEGDADVEAILRALAETAIDRLPD